MNFYLDNFNIAGSDMEALTKFLPIVIPKSVWGFQILKDREYYDYNSGTTKKIVKQGLLLCGYKEDTFIQFPSLLGAEELEKILIKWLDTIEYPEKPKIDGSAKKGFCLKSFEYNYILLEPYWQVFGK